MNKENVRQIFSHYIEKFDYINEKEHDETYKWMIAKDFRRLMDEALASDDTVFADALYKAKAATRNMIDSYTQPFHGLVEFARREPITVRQMFLDLFSDDGGDIHQQEEMISKFFRQCQVLQEKYFPNSYRYRQNSHSVSAYLFLYDPDHHYMYKATQAFAFADCIEFYDDWGTGDNIKLEPFYRMCDLLIEEIKGCDAIQSIDKTRFNGRFGYQSADLHQDTNKHILAFDLIYCCSVYNLFKGISYERPKMKEKQQYMACKTKAAELLAEHEAAIKEFAELKCALEYFVACLLVGTQVTHKTFGIGEISGVNESKIEIFFPERDDRKVFDLTTVLTNRFITADVADFVEKCDRYIPILKRGSAIQNAVIWTERALAPYEKYLD